MTLQQKFSEFRFSGFTLLEHFERIRMFGNWAGVIHRLPGCGLTGYPLGFHRLVAMNQTPPARAVNLTRVLDLSTYFVYESKVTFL